MRSCRSQFTDHYKKLPFMNPAIFKRKCSQNIFYLIKSVFKVYIKYKVTEHVPLGLY